MNETKEIQRVKKLVKLVQDKLNSNSYDGIEELETKLAKALNAAGFRFKLGSPSAFIGVG